LATFVIVAVACITYHGPAFMAENYADALSAVARDSLGSPLDKVLLLALVTAAAASLVSCILANARLSLSMAVHRAFPRLFGRVSGRYMVPIAGTVVWGALGATWFGAAKAVNTSVIYDAVLGTAFTIAFYYGATGLACVVYYRHDLRKSWRNLVFMGLLPSVGAAVMGFAFVRSALDYWDPAMTYSGGVFGIGMPVVIGLGAIAVAAVLAGVARVVKPQFFRDRRPETWPGENEPLPFSDETVA
jgi:amino acid transporter